MNTSLMFFTMMHQIFHHVTVTNKLLLEDNYDVLLESGGIILLEDSI